MAPRSRKLLIWVPIGVIVALVAGVWLLWSTSDLARASGSLDEQIAKAKAAGIALTPADLRIKTYRPDPENAAGYYKLAFQELKSSGAEKVFSNLRPKLVKGWSPADESAARQAVASYRKTLEAFTKPSLMKSVDFKRPWEKGPGVLLPEYASYKAGAGALSVRAEILSRDGDGLRALEDVETMVRIAKHAGAEPTLISVLVQISIYRMAMLRVESVVNRNPTGAVLDRADKIVDAMALPDMRSPMDGEMMMMRVAMQMIANDPAAAEMLSNLSAGDDAGVAVLPIDMRFARIASVRRAMEAKIVEELTTLYNELPEDPRDYKKARAALNSMDQRLARKDLPARYAASLMPVFGGIGDALASMAASKMVAKSAIKLLRIRPRPDRLPFETIDPFTDRPLIHKPSKSGFLLYSVDRDQKDDGGRRSSSEAEPGRDIVWSYP